MKKVVAWLLAICLLAGLSGCGSDQLSVRGTDLMKDFRQRKPEVIADLRTDGVAVTDFSIRLLRANTRPEENVVLSPLSVLYALSMTANGAEGNTKTQMETVMGLPTEMLNPWMYSYLHQFSDDETLHLSNAIWLKEDDGLIVEKDFLQINADYYGADIYESPFDERTCMDISSWVEKKTDGLIQDALIEIPEDAVMYLINAEAFNAEWEVKYWGEDIQDGVFTTESGEQYDVQMMCSEEQWYYEDAYATGFLKPYKDENFAFVALLPNEGLSMDEYLKTLDAEHLMQMLVQPYDVEVIASIPEFENECDLSMSQPLSEMGMPDAFDAICADFSRMAVYQGEQVVHNIMISQVLHKTYISVTAQGTKAAAETTVEMLAPTAPPPGEESVVKTVTLNRPFLYMIVDCENLIPIFMGITMEPNP